MKQIDEGQAVVRDTAEDIEPIAHPQPHVGEAAVADMGQRGGNPVKERFAADEAVVGKKIGAIGKMFARAETDFEMERAVVAEEAVAG